MGNFAINPPDIISLPIIGSEARFPVRRIYCVGKNYSAHVREMGGDPNRSQPVFFTKSRETIIPSGSVIAYPPQTDNLHFEIELVVALAGPDKIFGYGTGIDMTRRDIQAAAKAKGGPWDMAKNFDNAAPCSALLPADQAPDLSTNAIRLRQNGQVRQSSTLDKMIYPVDEILKHLSASLTLAAGDLIYTGTPEGVGPCKPGDHLLGEIEGLPSVEVRYV